MFRGLLAGDIIKVGKTVELQALDTPGHTYCHICLRSHTDQPALFSGDTLFNAGAGNCHNGGNVSDLFRTFDEQLSRLPDNTLIYPGHDYIENNLRFTLNREPGNLAAQQLLSQVSGQDVNQPYVSSMATEREVNTFFRLDSEQVVAELRKSFPDLPDQADAQTVFKKLRELRNSW
jgi:hydroxyacylglutathione hydrolase